MSNLDKVYKEKRNKFKKVPSSKYENIDEDNIISSDDFNKTIFFTKDQTEILDRIYDNTDITDPTIFNSNIDSRQIVSNSAIYKNVVLLDSENLPEKEKKDKDLSLLNRINQLDGLFKIKLNENQEALNMCGLIIKETENKFNINFYEDISFEFTEGEYLLKTSAERTEVNSDMSGKDIEVANVYYTENVIFKQGIDTTIKSEIKWNDVDIQIENGLIKDYYKED